MKIIPTILCGGAGSRLWPVSRESYPKPFIHLGDGESLLQKAFRRGAALPDVAEMLTVTNRDLFFNVEDEFREAKLNGLSRGYILEPVARNTAPAIAAAARYVADEHGGESLLLVLPADHLVANVEAFEKAVLAAMNLAREKNIVTFGIHPDGPETGYGYIEADGSRVVRFVEKPPLEDAQRFVSSGRYFWNSGMFCFRADTMLEEMKKHCPEILDPTIQCLAKAQVTRGDGFLQMELGAENFSKVPSLSIDYAVMERSDKVAMVSCDIGWSDIGSWSAIADLVEPDPHGNRVEGEATLHDTVNCYVRSESRMVGVLGVDNLVIIDTPDALLVADRDRVQDVREIYARLKAQGHESYKAHNTVYRPWGSYTVLEEGERFKIKRIVVKSGGKLSLQMHHHRSEHWVVVSGMAKIENGENVQFLRPNESTFIPAGHKHRLENPGKLDLVLIEVQSGEYLGEDDITRFEDVYGRLSAIK